jgi:hypothetical protein
LIRLAFDRAGTARTYDFSGWLHVAECKISRACISPYLGREIPNSERLGLDPDRIYQLLRDHPEELRRAVATFNGLSLLDRHKPATEFDHPTEIVIGATGSDASFDGSWLRVGLTIWMRTPTRG